jgi:hypothetical protein
VNNNQKLLIQFALRHLKSNLDEVTNEIVNSFWAFENEGDQLDDSQIEEQIDQCINQFGDEPKTLDNLRIDAADNCFAMADFGSMVVEETDGWQWDDFSNEWNRNVYVSSGGDEPTTRVRFKVVFEPNSAKVVDSEIIN